MVSAGRPVALSDNFRFDAFEQEFQAGPVHLPGGDLRPVGEEAPLFEVG